MKIHFSRSREKILINFSLRISRDQDSCKWMAWTTLLSLKNAPIGLTRFTILQFVDKVSHWRDAKKPNREEKEKLENNFSAFERRKRNLNSLSPISRREREIWISLPRLERRKRNLECSCPVSRGERETRIPFPSFDRRKRNLEFLCPVSRREREIGKYIKLSRREI